MKLNPEKKSTKKKSYPSLIDYNNSKTIMKTLGIILTPLMIFSCSDKSVPINKSKVQNAKVVEAKKESNKKLPLLKEKKRTKHKVTVDTIIEGDKTIELQGRMRRTVHKKDQKPITIIKDESTLKAQSHKTLGIIKGGK